MGIDAPAADQEEAAGERLMPLFWIVHEGPQVFIEDRSTLLYARMNIAMRGDAPASTFVEAHELDEKIAKKIPVRMIGRALSQREAKALLKRIG